MLCAAASCVGAWQAHGPTAGGRLSLAEREQASQQVGALMAASQQSLAQAEAYYGAAVEKAKRNLSELLTKEAKVLAATISDLAGELSNSSARLAQAANATRANMAASAESSAPSGAASFAAVDERASLASQVDSAERMAGRIARERQSLQQQAVSQATQVLEDVDPQLSRKLGDLSPILGGAEAIFQGDGPEMEDSASHLPSSVQKAADVGKHVSLSDLKQHLVAAKGLADSQVAVAQKRFAAGLAQVNASVSAGASRIKSALAAAEEDELRRVRARQVDKVPAHIRRHRHGGARRH